MYGKRKYPMLAPDGGGGGGSPEQVLDLSGTPTQMVKVPGWGDDPFRATDLVPNTKLREAQAAAAQANEKASLYEESLKRLADPKAAVAFFTELYGPEAIKQYFGSDPAQPAPATQQQSTQGSPNDQQSVEFKRISDAIAAQQAEYQRLLEYVATKDAQNSIADEERVIREKYPNLSMDRVKELAGVLANQGPTLTTAAQIAESEHLRLEIDRLTKDLDTARMRAALPGAFNEDGTAVNSRIGRYVSSDQLEMDKESIAREMAETIAGLRAKSAGY